MKDDKKHTPSSEPLSGDNLSVAWGESTEEEEVDFELPDLCKGPFCESTDTDKIH